jgi:hypothetical protein
LCLGSSSIPSVSERTLRPCVCKMRRITVPWAALRAEEAEKANEVKEVEEAEETAAAWMSEEPFSSFEFQIPAFQFLFSNFHFLVLRFFLLEQAAESVHGIGGILRWTLRTGRRGRRLSAQAS